MGKRPLGHVGPACGLRQAEAELLGSASDPFGENIHIGNRMFPANYPSSTYGIGWTCVHNGSYARSK